MKPSEEDRAALLLGARYMFAMALKEIYDLYRGPGDVSAKLKTESSMRLAVAGASAHETVQVLSWCNDDWHCECNAEAFSQNASMIVLMNKIEPIAERVRKLTAEFAGDMHMGSCPKYKPQFKIPAAVKKPSDDLFRPGGDFHVPGL